ncbi:MAG: DUF1778 domain-containing protein [Waterburya sp.]
MKKTQDIKSKMGSFFSIRNQKQEASLDTESKVLKLSAKDSELLIAALQNPPKPSEALLSVFE